MPDSAKDLVRREILASRRKLKDRTSRSAAILNRLQSLDTYRRARQVMLYVSARSEVETHDEIQRRLKGQRQVVVPFCQESHLTPFSLNAWEELEPGSFGIMEPSRRLRDCRERVVDPQTLELVIVPGVAFSPEGHRLGHGRGYYDRLLSRLNPSAMTIGLAFDCQLRTAIPSEEHDVRVDLVVTETTVYGRSLLRR